jgi:putative two-component system response regulator
LSEPENGFPTVLVVDDQPVNLELISAYLEQVECHMVTASDGVNALEVVARHAPDLVLLDAMMPRMDGFDVCLRLKADPATRLVPVVMVTALDRTSDRVKALDAGADDFLSKPVDRVELVARVKSLLRLKAVYDQLDDAQRVIFSLARAVEAKDTYTEAHTMRVANNARALAEAAGVRGKELETIYLGGIIHDIGKIGSPDAILMKAGPLTDDEREVMDRHPIIGEGIIKPLRSAQTLMAIVRHHHEKYDGSGYPDGLSGEAIPLAARIVAVADAFDALTSDRPYRTGRSSQDASQILLDGAGKQWDPLLVQLFVDRRIGISTLAIAGD